MQTCVWFFFLFFLSFFRVVRMENPPIGTSGQREWAALYILPEIFLSFFFFIRVEGRVGAKREHLNGRRGYVPAWPRTFHPWVSSDLRTWRRTVSPCPETVVIPQEIQFSTSTVFVPIEQVAGRTSRWNVQVYETYNSRILASRPPLVIVLSVPVPPPWPSFF